MDIESLGVRTLSVNVAACQGVSSKRRMSGRYAAAVYKRRSCKEDAESCNAVRKGGGQHAHTFCFIIERMTVTKCHSVQDVPKSADYWGLP